jgi:hypothetical protein
VATNDDVKRNLVDAGDYVSHMKGRNYRSPDEAFADLVTAQTKVNYALTTLTSTPDSGRSLMATDVPRTIEALIGDFLARAKEIAAKFKAAQFSIQVSGFPPSVGVSMSWTL